MTPDEAKIYDLERRVADLELEIESAHRFNGEREQSRERHALEIISDIATNAAAGTDIPTLEKVRAEFGLFCNRQANKQNAKWLNMCVDALDDIIAGRMDSTRLSAVEWIAQQRAKEQA